MPVRHTTLSLQFDDSRAVYLLSAKQYVQEIAWNDELPDGTRRLAEAAIALINEVLDQSTDVDARRISG